MKEGNRPATLDDVIERLEEVNEWYRQAESQRARCGDYSGALDASSRLLGVSRALGVVQVLKTEGVE